MEGVDGISPGAAVERPKSGELKIESYGRSLPSIKHPESNEDAISHSPQEGFAALFDGVGGQKDGAIASRSAKTSMDESLRVMSATDTDAAKRQMQEALSRAAQRVGQEAPGGGTTAVVVKFVENNKKAVIGSVGDSRAYLFRDGQLRQITEDDNLVTKANPDPLVRKEINARLDDVSSQADVDRLSPQEQNWFKMRNQITAGLDGSAVEPHVYLIALQEGDRLLLTSDGIHDNLTRAEIHGLVKTNSPDRVTDELVHAAQERSQGGHRRSKADDTSAILVNVKSESQKPVVTVPTSEAPQPAQVVQQEAPASANGGRSFSEWYDSWVKAGGDPREMIPMEEWRKTNLTADQAREIFASRRVMAGSDDAMSKLFSGDTVAQVATAEASTNGQPKNDEVIRKGAIVRVQRSDGRIEEGWEVAGYRSETGAAIVTKVENGKVVGKDIPRDEFKAANTKNPEDTVVELRKLIKERNEFHSADETGVKLNIVGLAQNPGLTPEQAKELVQLYAEYNTKVINSGIARVPAAEIQAPFDRAMRSLYAKYGSSVPQRPWW